MAIKAALMSRMAVLSTAVIVVVPLLENFEIPAIEPALFHCSELVGDPAAADPVIA